MGRAAVLCMAACLAAAAPGCGGSSALVPNTYEPLAIQDLQSVAVLPFYNNTTSPTIDERLREVLVGALLRRQQFYIRTVRDDELPMVPETFREEDLSLEDLAVLRRELGTDALLLGWIDRYATYPHMLMSVYVEMRDLATGEVVWVVNALWDSRDAATGQRMKQYYRSQQRDTQVPHDWEILALSPRLFHEFVAYEIAATLDRT